MVAASIGSDQFDIWLFPLLGDTELVYAGHRDDAVFIADLSVAAPGRGIGSVVIRALTGLADHCCVALLLNPWAPRNLQPGMLCQTDLEAWYGRHGWVWTDANDHIMIREPHVRAASSP